LKNVKARQQHLDEERSMAETFDKSADVKVFAPDRSLQAKVGTTVLDKLFTPEVIKNAEEKIVESQDNFVAEGFKNIDELEGLLGEIRKKPTEISRLLNNIITVAFALKSQAGIGGYDLIAALAKSLHVYCEESEKIEFNEKNIEIIEWHITSLRKLASAEIKGTGGEIGEKIMAEILRLNEEKP